MQRCIHRAYYRYCKLQPYILTGFFLYALVVLPLFIPVMAKTFRRAKWPFMKEERVSMPALL
nr:hypothetical protein [Anoxybacillus amylolyticus]